MSKYQEWYRRNKFLFNAKRSKKYRQDAAYREQCLERQRGYQLNEFSLVSRELPDQRVIMVYRVGQLKKIGITVVMIKEWEARGLIPLSIFTNSQHRYYTPEQVELLGQLKEVVESEDEVAISSQVELVSNNWLRGL